MDLDEIHILIKEHFGEKAFVAAAHFALEAKFDGREEDYQFWLRIHLKILYVQSNKNSGENMVDFRTESVSLEQIEAFRQMLLYRALH